MAQRRRDPRRLRHWRRPARCRAASRLGSPSATWVYIDAMLIRADVAWESLGRQHANAVLAHDGTDVSHPEVVTEATKLEADRHGGPSGKHEICSTAGSDDGDERAQSPLEPAYKRHTAVDDVFGRARRERHEGQPTRAITCCHEAIAVSTTTGTSVECDGRPG